jgi:hypothetical protein
MFKGIVDQVRAQVTTDLDSKSSLDGIGIGRKREQEDADEEATIVECEHHALEALDDIRVGSEVDRNQDYENKRKKTKKSENNGYVRWKPAILFRSIDKTCENLLEPLPRSHLIFLVPNLLFLADCSVC